MEFALFFDSNTIYLKRVLKSLEDETFSEVARPFRKMAKDRRLKVQDVAKEIENYRKEDSGVILERVVLDTNTLISGLLWEGKGVNEKGYDERTKTIREIRETCPQCFATRGGRVRAKKQDFSKGM